MENTFNTIIGYLENLGVQHTEIATQFRWNKTELAGALRAGINLPIMIIDAPETQTEKPNLATFHYHNCAFTILGKANVDTSKIDNYAAQNEVLNYCQGICFEIANRIKYDAAQHKINNQLNWLYGMLENTSFHYFKVGPIFANGFYGYRCEFAIKNKATCEIDVSKWNDLP